MGRSIAREVLPNGVNGTLKEGWRRAFRLQGRSGHGVQIQPTRGFVAAVEVGPRFVAEVVRVLLKGVVGGVCGCLCTGPQQGNRHR